MTDLERETCLDQLAECFARAAYERWLQEVESEEATRAEEAQNSAATEAAA